jgi:cell wall-associated NlpC family hydrolase
MHDYSKYIGIPFKYGGRDYNVLDCYGLVMLLYKEIHGIIIDDVTSPEYLADIHNLVAVEKLKWEACEPEVGAVIVFSIRGYGAHVGYYIGNDRFIHTWEKTGGVTIERFSLSWKHRTLGVYKWKQTNSLQQNQ